MFLGIDCVYRRPSSGFQNLGDIGGRGMCFKDSFELLFNGYILIVFGDEVLIISFELVQGLLKRCFAPGIAILFFGNYTSGGRG